MIPVVSALLLGAASCVAALPVENGKRDVAALDQAAFAEAQVRDDTATRAFSSVPITTSDGQCLFVDELSGDFRANLTPIQVAACDGSAGQSWDVITAGVHDNEPGTMLIVSTLTQACFNFDPRRAVGDQVILFSCGGRADGGGTVANSQLFPFSGGAGPLALTPENQPGSCLAVQGAVVGIADCNTADPTQSFTFGSTVARRAASPAITPAPLAVRQASATASSSVISVSRAGVVLNPSAAAEANPRDDTATRAFSAVPIKSSSGQCLFIDPTAGDFREELIPITLQDCDGSANQQFDFITAGVHNNAPNSTLIVSSLTQGCMNFDPRRAAGDTTILFSCGGRADGGGTVTNSQLFTFTAGETSLTLQPENNVGVCLAINAEGRLDEATCSGDPSQVFTIG